jgi:hypothetical protein
LPGPNLAPNRAILSGTDRVETEPEGKEQEQRSEDVHEQLVPLFEVAAGTPSLAAYYTRFVTDAADNRPISDLDRAVPGQALILEPGRWWALDAIFLCLLVSLVFVAWSRGALTSMVGGDALVALECGWRMLDLGFARPSQPIYGYGLCTMMAPLFVGAESLWDVALRRSITSGMYVPLTYVLVRVALPIVFCCSRPALQVGAFSAALAVARNEALGHGTSGGVHGYFVVLCIVLIFICWTAALRWRLGPSLVVGYTLVPIAMMNHPYSSWLVPAGLVLLPWFLREIGKLWVCLGLSAAVVVALPRIHWLGGRLLEGDTLAGLSGRAGQGATDGALWTSLTEVSTLPLVAGFVLLGLMLWKGFRRGGVAASHSAALGLCILASVVGFAAVVLAVDGYLQDYHLLQLYPWGALGWAALVGGAYAALSERLSGLSAVPRRAALVLLFLFLTYGSFRLSAGPSELEPPASLSYRTFLGGSIEPWRSRGVFTTPTAAGNHFYQRAILADLRDNVAADVPLLLTNFNPSTRREDSSVALGLSLHLAGVPAHRMVCCYTEQPPPVWYWVVDTEDAQLDYSALAHIEGIDVLPDIVGTDEIVLVIRSPAALASLKEPLCAALGSRPPMMGDYHLDWLSILDHRGEPSGGYPDSPLPRCLLAD